MKKLSLLILSFLVLVASGFREPEYKTEEWISLFDGKSFNGWKISEHPETFSIKDGMIVVHGDRAHLFYEGAVMNHNFKNFEFKVKVMTKAGR